MSTEGSAAEHVSSSWFLVGAEGHHAGVWWRSPNNRHLALHWRGMGFLDSWMLVGGVMAIGNWMAFRDGGNHLTSTACLGRCA